MNTKPSYLGLLNAISNGETEAECYLNAWAATTPSDDVRQVISTVALREGEHGKAFAKRMCELGYAVQPRDDGKGAERMAIAASRTLTDREKFDKLGLGRAPETDKPDFFARMFDNPDIDIQTGQLLGRYIAEERDSGRMFQGCYEALCAQPSNTVNTEPASTEDRLTRIEGLLAQLLERQSC